MSTTALGCAIFTSSPGFVNASSRRGRVLLYTTFGLSSLSFVVHGLVLHGWSVQMNRMSLAWVAGTAASNLVGAAFYTTRVMPVFGVLPGRSLNKAGPGALDFAQI